MKNSVKSIVILMSLFLVMAACLVIILVNDPGKNSHNDESEESALSSGVDDIQESVYASGGNEQIITADSIEREEKSDDKDPGEDSSFPDASPRAQEFLNSVRNVYEMVYNGDYVYGDSKAVPPCADGIISGDRMIARALWDMGYTDQPTGGETEFMTYLPEHGFEIITDKSQLRAGDIVQILVLDRPDHVPWTYSFVLVSYDPATERCKKYDMTEYTMDGKSRLKCVQPFDALLEENGKMRVFKWAFRIK